MREQIPIRLFRFTFFKLLLFLFYFNIFIMSINVLGTMLTGKGLRLHFIYYGFFYFIILILLFESKKINWQKFPDMYCLLFISYLIIVTSTLSIINKFGVISILVGLKSIIIPFLLYFLMFFALTSQDKIKKFMRAIVLGAVFAACYSMLELSNRIFHFSPFLEQAIYNYTVKVAPWATRWSGYAKTFGFERPLGIFFDLPSTAFFMAAGLVVIIIVGNNIGLRKRYINFLSILIFAGLLSSFSRLFIVIMLFFIFVLWFFKRKMFEVKDKIVIRKKLNLLIAMLLLLFIVVFFWARTIITEIYFPLINLSSTSTSQIIAKNLFDLISSDIWNLAEFSPFTFLFGVGFLSSSEDFPATKGLTGELHFIRYHLSSLGTIGFALYSWIFIHCLFYLYKSIKSPRICNQEDRPFYVCGFFLCLLYLFSFIHYGVGVFANNFIIAMVLFLTNRMRRTIWAIAKKV